MIGTAYRLQMTSASSFGIRATGLALIGGIALFVAWILSAAVSREWFDCVNWLATSWFGWLVWILSAWAAWFHLLGGLRHFVFDQAKMMEIGTAERLGWAMFIGATVLTAVTILVAVA